MATNDDLLKEFVESSPKLNPRLARWNKERLLAEVEEVLRIAPSLDMFSKDSGSDEHLAWLGRAGATISRWDIAHSVTVSAAMHAVPSDYLEPCRKTLFTFKVLLQQAKADLIMDLGRSSVVVPEGQQFHYFDGLRKLIETARSEVFFVDPYLDADFVSRYLPYVAKGCAVRLLGRYKVTTLLPAVDMFTQQSGTPVSVRVSKSLHDRYLFVDRSACYQSGASFKGWCEERDDGNSGDHRRLSGDVGRVREAVGQWKA